MSRTVSSDGASADPNGVVIVGGGLAGLFCALKLAPLPVTVLAAAPIGEGASSAWAQGGIAAAMSQQDTVESHLADTLAAGAGIVDVEIARGMIADGPARIHDLLSYGVPFDRDLEGRLALSREAAHSQRRIVRVRGDLAGRAIMEALVAAVRKTPSIRVLEGWTAEELILSEGRVTGVCACRTNNGQSETDAFSSSAVVLCTGGVGHLYRITTNPVQSRGGGLGMAARAGATIADPEFVQFHPTAIDVGHDPAPLATEALRGDGALLVNRDGNRFMKTLHPNGELAPRDIVARAIFAELAAGRGAFLDCTKAVGRHFPDMFPTVYRYCREAGIDPVREPIPVVPAAHYHMGGVLTDSSGRTALDGLWAAGEVTSTGAHGANRLASNSLLEAIVFAARIAEDIRETGKAGNGGGETARKIRPAHAPHQTDGAAVKRLRTAMSANVGVVRSRQGLMEAIRTVARLETEAASPAFFNALAAAKLVAAAALLREESRGGHYRADFPAPDTAQARRTLITLERADRLIKDIG